MEDFAPSERLDSDLETVLLYDGDKAEGDKVLDLSGHDHHGTWQRFEP